MTVHLGTLFLIILIVIIAPEAISAVFGFVAEFFLWFIVAGLIVTGAVVGLGVFLVLVEFMNRMIGTTASHLLVGCMIGSGAFLTVKGIYGKRTAKVRSVYR